MLIPQDRPLVGVSGGADSVCLALVLRELGYEIAIAHVNHGLRGAESDGDEEFTSTLAARLGVKCFCKKVALPNPSNLEAAGREARNAFFNETAHRHGLQKIALAHKRN